MTLPLLEPQGPEIVLRIRHPGQAMIVGESKRFNVLMCGRRFGKTALGIDLAVEMMLDGKRVGWFAPTYKYLLETWRELVSTLRPMPGMDKSETEHRIQIPTGGVIECWTMETDDPARSRFYDLAIIDEAGLVPTLARIWNGAIRSTLAQTRGGAWFFGTPKVTGDFTAFWAKGQDTEEREWMSWRLPMSANPYIDASEIDAMRADMPESDFRREVLGEVVDEGEHPIGLEHIKACTGTLSQAEPCVWGVDLARAVDYTVVVGLDAGGQVCRLERWRGPWGTTKSRLDAMLGTTIAYIDSTGVGDPIVEDLQRLGKRVQPSVFSARSKQQWVEGMIAGIQQHRLRYPAGWLVAELIALTAERTAMGTRYSAPEGLHDDGVMALALAWHGYSQSGYAKIPKPEDPGKLPDHARRLEIEHGQAVRPRKEPTSFAELEEYLERRHTGRLPHRERERLPLRRYGR